MRSLRKSSVRTEGLKLSNIKRSAIRNRTSKGELKEYPVRQGENKEGLVSWNRSEEALQGGRDLMMNAAVLSGEY